MFAAGKSTDMAKENALLFLSNIFPIFQKPRRNRFQSPFTHTIGKVWKTLHIFIVLTFATQRRTASAIDAF